MESMGGGHGPHSLEVQFIIVYWSWAHIRKKSNNDNSIVKEKRHRPDQCMILALVPHLYLGEH
jgi:hypothetical protein